ncbi:hypothetical protein FAZ19_11910 [Sphingobacterium alkalisoli]|uniref:Uncharacterized protein n=1 Tax=Sphingobacterium alkalisoli TaxID=1874115 RepID=A0A4U0H2F3_9SPHI|nr:hypothetical protein [Sphingobacterium alkalisoli]TJY65817.1 hypothetical protein FAZ19_11910 [Sphingobacterium alkalisoli]GGH18134.1 hypothetical protein GCM10011418_21580 [Sphingobacterium alkalisoli]
MKSKKENDMTNKNQSFIRWQGRAIEELGKTVNLLLALCLATIGFVVSKFLEKDFSFNSCIGKVFILIGSLALLFDTIILLLVMLNRLNSFKSTAQIARQRETENRTNIKSLRNEVTQKDKCTWILFKYSIVIFVLGELFIILGLFIEIFVR